MLVFPAKRHANDISLTLRLRLGLIKEVDVHVYFVFQTSILNIVDSDVGSLIIGSYVADCKILSP